MTVASPHGLEVEEPRRWRPSRRVALGVAVALAAGAVLASVLLSRSSAPETAMLAPPDQQLFVRAGGNESSGGDGPWLGQEGMFEGYRTGKHFAVLFTIKNTSSSLVTLVAAGGPQPGIRLMRRVGVQFRLVPPPPRTPENRSHGRPVVSYGTHTPFGLRPWRAGAPKPLVVPAERSVWIQFDFVFGNCGLLPLGASHTYNRSTVVVYRLHGRLLKMPIDLRGDQVTVTGC
jgi:hypothetical protein